VLFCFFGFLKIEDKPGEKAAKVDKWDWNAVKNALDDATTKFLSSQKNFKEDHTLMNMKLIISTVAVLFSGIALVYDWMHPFPKSQNVMFICVIW
jgi:signal peptidase complex subunit 2